MQQNKHIQIRVTYEIHKHIRVIAAELGITINQLLLNIIDDYLRKTDLGEGMESN